MLVKLVMVLKLKLFGNKGPLITSHIGNFNQWNEHKVSKIYLELRKKHFYDRGDDTIDHSKKKHNHI